MRDFITGLLPGGGLTAIIGAVIAGIAALGALLVGARKAGKDAAKADRYEEHLRDLEKLKRAADARPSGDELSDPYNRDRR